MSVDHPVAPERRGRDHDIVDAPRANAPALAARHPARRRRGWPRRRTARWRLGHGRRALARAGRAHRRIRAARRLGLGLERLDLLILFDPPGDHAPRSPRSARPAFLPLGDHIHDPQALERVLAVVNPAVDRSRAGAPRSTACSAPRRPAGSAHFDATCALNSCRFSSMTFTDFTKQARHPDRVGLGLLPRDSRIALTGCLMPMLCTV